MARTTPSYALAIQDPVSGRRVSVASNRNLVDNAWFTINQLGATEMPTNVSTPWIDRWRFQSRSSASSTLTWTENGLVANVVSGTLQIQQRYAEPRLQDYKYYMVSCMTADGDIYQVAMKADGSPHWIGGGSNPYFNLTMTSTRITLRFVPASNDKVLRALKIEDPALNATGGTPGTSLAWDSAPDYTTELLKCQRYMYVAQGDASQTTLGLAVRFTTAGLYRIFVNMPVSMPQSPSVSLSPSTISNLRLISIDGTATATGSIGTINAMSNTTAVVTATFPTSFTSPIAHAYLLNSAKMIFNAEDY